jgi:general secretion pathway protein G
MQRHVRRPARRATKRSAFTLLEVMLVLVIIAAIAGIAVYNLGGMQTRGFKMAAKNQITVLKGALDQYRLMMGTYPSSLDALYQAPSDADTTNYEPILRDPVPADPWGHKYEYKLEGSSAYDLRSLGPDGQSGTDDDITSTPGK